MKGKLILLPCGLGERIVHTVPPDVRDAVQGLDAFVVEHDRSARRFLRAIEFKKDFDEVKMWMLDKHDPEVDMGEMIRFIEEGNDLGLISEAGYPAVADPGNLLVRRAHDKGILVEAHSGPSSIIMALSASGMNGQEFHFHGYIPVKDPDRRNKIHHITNAADSGVSQIFMETPYRNNALFDQVVKEVSSEMHLCIAANISLEGEYIKTQKVSQWKNNKPDLNKKPAIFILCRLQ